MTFSSLTEKMTCGNKFVLKKLKNKLFRGFQAKRDQNQPRTRFFKIYRKSKNNFCHISSKVTAG